MNMVVNYFLLCLQEIEMTTVLEIGSNDERFGFSVMGGLEEGFLPSVDAILKGKKTKDRP